MRAPVLLSLLAVGAVACGDNLAPGGEGPITIIDSAAPLVATPHVTITFHSTGAAARFACRLDDADAAACGSPWAFDATDGIHSIAITATDDAGVAGPAATATFSVDTMAPDTVISVGPSAVETTATAAFTFAASPADATATFECAVDVAAFTPCTTPAIYTVAEGAHTFAVAARDAAGHLDPTPASLTWTIDLNGPSLQLLAMPTDPSHNPSPTFTFSSDAPDATFECAIDGIASFAACTSPFTAPALLDGPQTFRLRARDAAQLQTDLAYAWVLDTVAPTVTITAGPDGATATASPVFEFTAAGDLAALRCALDAGTAMPCTSPFTASSPGEGSHTFTVTASDAAGNAGFAMRMFVIDSIRPTVTIVSGPSGRTNVRRPTWTFTTTDSPSIIECSIDLAPAIACTTAFMPATDLAPGPHTFRVRVADIAGNESTATRAFVVDTDGPVVTITGGPAGSTSDASPTFTFTVAGATSSARCRVDGGSFTPCAGSFTTPGLGGGTHVFEVQADDDAGNTGAASRAFEIDSTAPTVSITSAPGSSTNDPTATFTFVAGATATTVTCQVDGGAFVDCTSPFTTLTPADGSHTFAVRACSAFPSCSTDTRTFTVDTAAPTLVITGGPQDPIPTDAVHPSFAFTATGATSTRCRITDATHPSPGFVACTSPVVIADALAEGPHELEVIAADDAGNQTTATRAFTVDTATPVIAIDAPVIPSSTSLARPVIHFHVTDATATSTTCTTDAAAATACDGTVGYRAAVALPEGAHQYAIRAVDAGGRGTLVVVDFVVDLSPPTITITGGPDDPTNDDSPTFTFTTSSDTTRTVCDLDGGTVIDPCATGVTFPAVSPGQHAFHVTTYDTASPPNTAQATSAFFLGSCGDGVAQGTEACDAGDIRGQTCGGLAFTAGTLGCTASCTLDTTQCTTCGNGVIEAGEECEGANLAGATCTTEGFQTGALACDATTCQRDPDGCSTCGDGVVSGAETCDGTDVGTATCESEGHAPGTLACGAACDAFATTGCDGGYAATSDPFPTGAQLCVSGLLWMSSVQALAACTTNQGIFKLHTNAAGTSNPIDTWLNLNQGTTPITTLQGHAIALTNQGSTMLLYFTEPSLAGVNSWRSVAFPSATPANIAWGTNQMGQASLPIQIYAGLPGSSTNNLMAGYSAGLGGAAITHGQNNAAAVTTMIAAGVTGTVTSIAAAQGFTPSSDITVAVLGTTSCSDIASRAPLALPTATGGIFNTCDLSGTLGGTFVERDRGLGADRDRVGSVTVDNASYSAGATRPCAADGNPAKSYATRLYAAIRGGARVYKTEDGGDSWTAMGDGIPTTAAVYQIAIAGTLLYAATSTGLYTYDTTDLEATRTWRIAGLEGQTVRSVVVANRTPITIYVGVDDSTDATPAPATRVFAGPLRASGI